MNRRLFHGSESIVDSPSFGVGNMHNDYGRGFYCTTDKGLANEWAIRNHNTGFVNEYALRDDRLKILDLTKPPYDDVLCWVALLMANRRIASDLAMRCPKELDYLRENYLVDVTQYDVVIGYRADDAYFRFPESFIRSELSVESLRMIYRAGNLGKQYVLISPKAFKALKFVGYHNADIQSRADYYNRVSDAGKQHQLLLGQDRYAKETRLIDLVRQA